MRPPESWNRAPATVVIAVMTAAAWLVAWTGGLDQAGLWIGFTPAHVTSGPLAMRIFAAAASPLTATLVHAGFLHLFFNLIIHLYCGRSVETIVGSRALVLLYVLGAYAAAGAQFVADPGETVPMVGASGAISAIIGAYAMLFGRNRVKVANATAATLINALWVIVAWAAIQYLLGSMFRSAMNLNIAIAAHVGGFVAGLALARPLLLWRWRGA
ncbi:MAG TPA: rhomboid family intramembrane serine protease [Allosphingosinicella sp.]|jgi:membrane associated rhomboid family serine protease